MQENVQPQARAFNYTPSISIQPPLSSQAGQLNGMNKVERRQTRRYQVQGRLLSVCEFYAGQILNISRTGLAFQIVHFLPTAGGKAGHHPLRSDKLDILSPGLSGYYFRNLQVKTIWDLNVGRLYPENDSIIAFRRSVQLVEPLRNDQLESLQRYLRGKIDEAAPANYFS